MFPTWQIEINLPVSAKQMVGHTEAGKDTTNEPKHTDGLTWFASLHWSQKTAFSKQNQPICCPQVAPLAMPKGYLLWWQEKPEGVENEAVEQVPCVSHAECAGGFNKIVSLGNLIDSTYALNIFELFHHTDGFVSPLKWHSSPRLLCGLRRWPLLTASS